MAFPPAAAFILFTHWTGLLAGRRGRRVREWYWMGALFGPFALLAVALPPLFGLDSCALHNARRRSRLGRGKQGGPSLRESTSRSALIVVVTIALGMLHKYLIDRKDSACLGASDTEAR
jgi:ABC-type Fe3+ transport system permease subunit